MCPYIDMFNHKSNCISDVSFNYFSGYFELRTQEYSKGDQVFINYGKQSNDRFLQFYGFVEVDNPFDIYDFGINVLELVLKYGDRMAAEGLLPSYPPPEQRLRAIATSLRSMLVQDPAPLGRRAALINGDEFHTLYSRSAVGQIVTVSADPVVVNPSARASMALISRFDGVTVRALRALLCSEEEWNGAVEKDGSETLKVNLDKTAVAMSPNTEQKLTEALRVIADEELKSKPTTVEEDKELLSKLLSNKISSSSDASGSFGDSSYAAVVFRIEKKKLLLEALH